METTNLLSTFEQKATQAHNLTSFDPEKRGKQMIEDYGTELQQDIEELKANGIETEQINNYIERYKQFFSSYLSAKSRTFSVMITGAGNFPMRRHEKANRSRDKHYEVFREWRERAKKSIFRKSKPVATYLSEIDRYKTELEGMKKNHDLMKEGNKRIKQALKDMENIDDYLMNTFNVPKHMIDWTMKFGFGLQNNNANMKRVEQRIKELEQKEAHRQTEPEKDIIFKGGKVVMNYEIDRIQIFFDNRPTSEELTEWKQKGLSSFNWSPYTKSWMRKITANAIWSTKRMLKDSF